MDHRRHILPSSFTVHQFALDNSSGLSRARQPLADSAGNAQHHTLASVGLYHDSKGHQPRGERSMYSIHTIPSQPPRQSAGNTLGLRRQSTRRQRHLRFSRNPIIESSQYQAYRARQEREGSGDDSKWPPELEDSFLDALMNLPHMGRRKFSLRGRPHGRNELITEYLWIAYCESLPEGVRPDPSMRRGRKQVSSHIQVLKGFLKDHPAFDRLFPPPRDPKNGFEDSFKNDPCLRAIAEGRLPRKRHDYYENQSYAVPSQNSPLRPVLFWLLMTSSSLAIDDRHRDVHEQDLYAEGLVAHRFTGLSVQRGRDSLESISNWRQRFPYLQQLNISGELDCDIIHMEASLNLLTTQPPEGSELCSRTVLSIPGRHTDGEWRIVTTLSKPPELYRDQISDPPLEAQPFLVEVTSVSNGETRIKVPFPASPWAQTFSCLRNIQSKHEESLKHGYSNGMGHIRPARDYVDLISMYQEVQSRAGPDQPYVRRAIILWTFKQASGVDRNGTSWRYLDATPPRRMCMSPSPHPSHHVQASMNETFNSWSEPNLQLQHPNMLDTFVQGLATPPHTAGLQSPFAGQNYTYANQYDLPSENLSFVSATNTMDSEATLVDHSDVTSNIDNFLCNSAVHLNDFDPTEHSTQSWQLPVTESFSTDPTWANYTVPTTTPAIAWDTSEVKNNSWPELQSEVDVKSWGPVEDGADKHWAGHNEHVNSSPTKGTVTYIEQSIEQKLLPWIDSHRSIDEVKNTYEDVGQLEQISQHHLPVQSNTGNELKSQQWDQSHDDFDYASLAERLK